VLGPIGFWRIVSALDKVASLASNGLMPLLLLYLYTSQSVSQSVDWRELLELLKESSAGVKKIVSWRSLDCHGSLLL
jgi:hypothetical protein